MRHTLTDSHGTSGYISAPVINTTHCVPVLYDTQSIKNASNLMQFFTSVEVHLSGLSLTQGLDGIDYAGQLLSPRYKYIPSDFLSP